MGSMNNWLGLSLASHLQQHCQIQSGVDASNRILSNFSQPDVNGYGSCSSTGFELPSNTTTASLGMDSLRSDNGSLCLFEAINRTHNAGAECRPKRLSCQPEAMKPESMTSIYHGVTRNRWTGKYEAQVWDNSFRRDGRTRKGRQVRLGVYDTEEKAAMAYDLAALKYSGPSTRTNFPISNYEKELEEMKHISRQEHITSLKRKSSRFSRGTSTYRGVSRQHQHGRWKARIGIGAGKKNLHLGTFSTEEEAAEAYDIAAIKLRGLNAVTNFDMSWYDVKSITNSALPIGGLAKRIKEPELAHLERTVDGPRIVHDEDSTLSSQAHDNVSYGNASAAAKAAHEWPLLAFQKQLDDTSSSDFGL